MLRNLLICLGLALLTAAAFCQVGDLGFINYDDPVYVYQNRQVCQGLTWDNVRWAFTTGEASNWHPLTWLSHMLDVEVFGVERFGVLRAGPHHAVNLAFHVANTLLVFLVLRRLTGRREKGEGRGEKEGYTTWLCALVAGLFAVHPLHVESVAWVAERKDVLSTFFGLLCMAAYVEYAQRTTYHVPRTTSAAWAYYALTVLFLALSLLAKPMLVTLPFVFLLLDYWPLERYKTATGGRDVYKTATGGRDVYKTATGGRDVYKTATGGRDVYRTATVGRDPDNATTGRGFIWLVVEKLPLFALAIASAIVTYFVQERGGAMFLMDDLPWTWRVQNALIAYAGYLGHTVWPVNLAVPYPLPDRPDAAEAAAAILILLAISALVAWGAWRGRKYLAVGWLWYLGMLVPVIGLVQVGDQAMADRYTYLPLLGIFIAVTWGAAELVGVQPSGCESTLKRELQRESPRWRVGLVCIAAIAVLVACFCLTTRQLAFWVDNQTLFRHTLKVTQNNATAHNSFAIALVGEDRVDDAIEHYREALAIKPNYTLAHNNLGLALEKQGKLDEAIFHYQEALSVKRDYAKALNNLGFALLSRGRPADVAVAADHFRHALRVKPDYAKAHYGLANALFSQGQWAEAADHYRAALDIEPDYAKAYRGLAWLLATAADPAARNAPEALELAGRAVQLAAGRERPGALDTLAAAQAAAGQFDQAAATAEQAEQLALRNGQTVLASKIHARGELYRAGSPFHETGVRP